MKRITVTDNSGNFMGWFDLDASTEIAEIRSGSPYITGSILLVTALGKLIINDWNNSGGDTYRFAEGEAEIAEILVGGCSTDQHLSDKLADILAKYEI